ncbi:hypothetical protein F3Y22_tig00012104pilonHSYRG00098 [Hibiscus syriacus]|uniref:Peptidase C14 caspase domain-containing protein n=1 Tax=Hibiscus syriacus TaxID=106335 RepID=A0A6A3C933_HIBSY|nr:metacaspase-9-like [Hibiscus syriacus]KAE8723672.1 hypothetical protein F3Y22_tig00012104pilonHSYRG00098 [Hibiscus syriacus]
MARVTKRAVLVGCTYNKTRFSLYGCINDVRKMNDLIVNRLGFRKENVKVLTDEPLPELTSAVPTAADIRDALSEMVETAGAGDVLFFYFSGHGTAIPVYVPGRPYREEKAIVSCDLDLITGIELRRLVDKLTGGATLTMAIDSSYSGGLIAGGKEQVGSNTMIPFPTSYARLIRKSIDYNAIRDIRSKASYPFSFPWPTDQETDSSPPQDGGILLSGCDANETSFDLVGGGEAYGAFTNTVLTVIGKRRDCPANARLVYEAREKLKEDGIGVEQNPCLYCSNANVNAPFLGGFVNIEL